MVKFSWKNKLLPSLMAVALASGVAFSGNANAIHLAEDGIGQVLLAPLYLADPSVGYNTKLTVVNTREDIAVKAKVVIRSAVASTELLDFILYLSPGDVWRGEIRYNNGRVELYSDDDSIKNDQVPAGSTVEKNADGTTFASILPVTQEVYTLNLGKNDVATMGHIEVIGLYGVKNFINLPGGKVVNIFRGMAKFELAKIFDAYPRAAYLDPINSTNEISSIDPNYIQLTGSVEMISNTDRVGYRMPALAGSIGDNVPSNISSFLLTLPANSNIATFDGLVVSNPLFDAKGGIGAEETTLGDKFGDNESDKIIEIERALATTNIIGSFEDDSYSEPQAGVNRTRLVVTFPTRYRHGEKSDPLNEEYPSNPCGAWNVTRTDQFSPPFKTDGRIEYNIIAFNNHENDASIKGSVFSGGPIAALNKLVEVNYFIPQWPTTKKEPSGALVTGGKNFESGWFNMLLSVREGCPYPGAPTLSFIHKYKEYVKGEFTQSWFVPAIHKPLRGVCAETTDGDYCRVQ